MPEMSNSSRQAGSSPEPRWFDSLAKAVAQGRVSRRSMMGGIAGLFGVAASRAARAEAMNSVHPLPPALAQAVQMPRPSNCQRSERSGTVQEDTLVTDGGLTMHSVREATGGDRPKTKLTRTVSKGDSLLYELEIEARSETDFSLSLHLGPDVTGAKAITLNTLSGEALRGQIDGRLFSATLAHASIREARFTDGLPAPRLNYPAALKASGPRLAAAEAHARTICTAVGTRLVPQTTAQVFHTLSGTLPGASGDRTVTRDKTPSNWTPPLTHESVACDRCYTRCGDRYVDCIEGDIWDIIEDIGSAGGKVAYCLVRWGACMGNCRLPGQGCCPVLCGDVFSGSCCGEGKHCLGNYGCCEAGQIVCANSCCDPGVSHCGTDGYCGCPDPYRECGTTGCYDPSHQICCNGVICPQGSICHNGSCCRGNVCADGSCCDLLGDTCCNGTCCRNGECINGTCCPQHQICGSACCAAGQDCLDRDRSVCGTLAPANCGSPQLSLLRPCRSTRGAQEVSTCCERGMDCCNGQCCGFGEICCWATNSCQRRDAVCGPH